MKTLPIIIMVFLAIGCSQQKQVTTAPTNETVNHRYMTVYEGNRILKYGPMETVSDQNSSRPQAISISASTSEMKIKPTKIERLQRKKFAKRKMMVGYSIQKGASGLNTVPDSPSSARAKANGHSASQRGGANIGIGILLIIVSIPIFLYGLVIAAWGVYLIGIGLMLLGIAALVYGIVLVARA